MAESSKNPSIDETQDHGGDIDKSPLLVVNDHKNLRLQYEQTRKTMKWNFTTPDEEFEFLKKLMNLAGFDKTLIGNMFHVDFRYRLKAIKSLRDDLPDNIEALVSNLDLILKWLRLRFFDTNSSVILKSFKYLQTVLNALDRKQYCLHKNEAASFIPYLITKFGDPEDAVRMGVRSVFRHISHVYSSTKLFSYLLSGIKSENAQQRTECLDQMSSFIDKLGTSVCTSYGRFALDAVLREVAKQIADRDNSVRDAALNCIEQAYYYEGELIFKLIGQIPETDLSLLKERIKKASKNRPVESASSARAASASTAPVDTPPVQDMDVHHDDKDNEEEEPKEPDEISEERNRS